MKSIRRSAFITLFFISFAICLLFLLFNQAKAAFQTNIFLNGSILGILIFGIFYNVFLFVRLRGEFVWFSFFEKSRDHESSVPKPKILKTLQQLFQGVRPSAFMLQSTFGSIQNRFDETRDINRYVSGLLIFIGLLGTFWGLSHTVNSISGVISGIDLQTGNVQDAFNTLRNGLKAPLTGMGTAFSSSMFGLLGSLMISFIDVQYGKAVQGFFYYMEERIQLGHMVSLGSVDTPTGSATYSQSLLEQAAESMQHFSKQLQRTEENRNQFLKNLIDITEKLNLLVDQQTQQTVALQTLSQHQFAIHQVITNQNETNTGTLKYWRSLDTRLGQLIEEITSSKHQMSREICDEIRTVSRILAALGEGKDSS
jgi:hypothetical protein